MHLHMVTHLHTYMHVWPCIMDGLNHHTTLAKLDGDNKCVFILDQNDLWEQNLFQNSLCFVSFRRAPGALPMRPGEVTDLTPIL